MIRSVLKNKKFKEYTIKIVMSTEEQAVEKSTELLDYLDENRSLIKKMEIGLGLVDLKINDVFNNVIIQYAFSSVKDAKQFEKIFCEALNDDNSNITEAILVFEKREVKEQSTYLIKLKLPSVTNTIFKHHEVNSYKPTSHPHIEITRELFSSNGKKLILLIDDFSSEYISIKTSKKSDTYIIPQAWADIEELAKAGVYDTKWVMDVANVKQIKEGAIVSTKNGKAVEVSQNLIKKDGQSSKFLKDGDFLIDANTTQKVPQEIVIMEG